MDFDSLTVKKIARFGFNDLQSLKILNLGFQSITDIERNAFNLLPNMTDLLLNNNKLKQILDDTILPGSGSSLVTLDLSHNPELCRIGNTLR